jgi:uncharacterized protein
MSSIAILGASNNRRKFGNIAVRAYAENGFDVYPVNPRESDIEGHLVYPFVNQIPAYLDRVSVYLPPEKFLPVLDELAEINIGELWLNPGSDAPEVVDKALSLGFDVHCGCSIIDIGLNPAEYPA